MSKIFEEEYDKWFAHEYCIRIYTKCTTFRFTADSKLVSFWSIQFYIDSKINGPINLLYEMLDHPENPGKITSV